MATTRPDISIQETLFEQVELLARQLNISHDQLFELALGTFVRFHQEQNKQVNSPIDDQQRIINQGDVFWIESQDLNGIEMGNHRHPYVVIQDNLFNHSRIHSVVVCALTTNLKQATAPGNVLLEVGEANLLKQSAVVVSKVSSVNKSQLGDYIGSLDKQRIEQILAGMRFLQASFFAR